MVALPTGWRFIDPAVCENLKSYEWHFCVTSECFHYARSFPSLYHFSFHFGWVEGARHDGLCSKLPEGRRSRRKSREVHLDVLRHLGYAVQEQRLGGVLRA